MSSTAVHAPRCQAKQQAHEQLEAACLENAVAVVKAQDADDAHAQVGAAALHQRAGLLGNTEEGLGLGFAVVLHDNDVLPGSLPVLCLCRPAQQLETRRLLQSNAKMSMLCGQRGGMPHPQHDPLVKQCCDLEGQPGARDQSFFVQLRDNAVAPQSAPCS